MPRILLAAAMIAVLAAAVAGRSTTGAHAAAAAPLFVGDFETGSYRPWAQPQCANYGQPPGTKTFGNFFIETSLVGQGRAAGRFDVPTDRKKLTRCEVFTTRPIGVGGDDYYSLMVYMPKGWSPGTTSFWGASIAQLNFENLPAAPIALQAHADHVTLVVQSGVCSTTTCQYRSNGDAPSPNLPALYAIPKPMQLGVWHELIVAVHWATDSHGSVTGWHRLKGQTTWTKTLSLTGYPTIAVNGAGAYPPSTQDKIGLYRAQSTAATSVWLDGFARSKTFATAAATLP